MRRLTLVPTKVLKMSDDVLCVKVSADNRLLAVSLLDNTIKVFFADTLKVSRLNSLVSLELKQIQ